MDPSQGLPTATHRFDNGSPELEDQNGARELEDENGAPELEPVDVGDDSFEAEPDPGPEASSDASGDDDSDDYRGAPAPLEHATPDVELAEEQLEFARPAEPEPGDEEDEEEFEREVDESVSESGRRRRRGGRSGGSGRELTSSGGAVAERGPSTITRLIGFLQGSWRELHRVQWPDRRQVMQATGVVIGFVIIAAVFLGASDWVSSKIVTFVLK
ncbi:MAG: preprotein translocase subunit SecE [Solirubrobacteraceae bacterium]